MVPTMEAMPPVMKWANLGHSSGSYNASLAPRVTGLMRDMRKARYFGEREASKRLEGWSGIMDLIQWGLVLAVRLRHRMPGVANLNPMSRTDERYVHYQTVCL